MGGEEEGGGGGGGEGSTGVVRKTRTHTLEVVEKKQLYWRSCPPHCSTCIAGWFALMVGWHCQLVCIDGGFAFMVGLQ